MLDDVHLHIEHGGYVTLVGPSGSGKTTLLSLLGGLERPQAGTIVVGGQDLARLSGKALADYRRNTVGFVFQHFGLLASLTALENVELALSLAGTRHARRRGRASELLGEVGLAERLSHRPAQLSGGERQRVAIARALANRPELILADEPTGDLDAETATTVADLLGSLRAEQGCSLVVVTHSPTLAARAERRVSLRHGRLAEADAGEGGAGPIAALAADGHQPVILATDAARDGPG